jgi:tetrahydromethanopterin S-methyltransferase subunit E
MEVAGFKDKDVAVAIHGHLGDEGETGVRVCYGADPSFFHEGEAGEGFDGLQRRLSMCGQEGKSEEECAGGAEVEARGGHGSSTPDSAVGTERENVQFQRGTGGAVLN